MFVPETISSHCLRGGLEPSAGPSSHTARSDGELGAPATESTSRKAQSFGSAGPAAAHGSRLIKRLWIAIEGG